MQLAYRSLVGRDRVVTRAEFWRMQPAEVWWLIEERQPPQAKADGEAEATRERAADYKAEAEAAGFTNVGDYWRARARQGAANG